MRERQVELAADKGQQCGRAVGNDGVLDAIQKWPVRLPVIGVTGQPNRFVAPEFDEPERPGADRMRPHFGRRHMAGVDHRVARRQQRQHRRLRPVQPERHAEIAVGNDLFQVVIPTVTRVGAQRRCRSAQQQVPGAFDIGGGERLTVMPAHALPQREGQFGVVGAPGPTGRQIRHDRVDAVARLILPIHHQIVENPHERHGYGVAGFLQDRRAAGAVAVKDPQHAAMFGLLGDRRRHKQTYRRHRGQTKSAHHVRSPIWPECWPIRTPRSRALNRAASTVIIGA